MTERHLQKVILLADDDLDDAEIFTHILQEFDPQITIVHIPNGASLLSYFKDPACVKPQVIFLDLNMPEMNGWQCLTELKRQQSTAEIPVVIYTTSSQQRDRQQAIASGAAAFITKPSDYMALKKMLLQVSRNLLSNLLKTLEAL